MRAVDPEPSLPSPRLKVEEISSYLSLDGIRLYGVCIHCKYQKSKVHTLQNPSDDPHLNGQVPDLPARQAPFSFHDRQHPLRRIRGREAQ